MDDDQAGDGIDIRAMLLSALPPRPATNWYTVDELKERMARKRRHRNSTIGMLGVTVVALLLILVLLPFGESHRPPSHAGASPSATSPRTTGPSLPPAGDVIVPNVLGETTPNAVHELQAVDLTNSIDTLDCPGLDTGYVVGQSPEAGFRAAPDSRVDLRISCGDAPKTQSVSTPPAVLNAAQNAASEDGDPHPQLPVQWVQTTDHAAAAILGGETPADSSIYLVQIQGYFPSCPPCTGLLPQPPGTVIILTIPVDGSAAGSGFSFGTKVQNLSTLGLVHTFDL
jgi:hypothetical protein